MQAVEGDVAHAADDGARGQLGELQALRRGRECGRDEALEGEAGELHALASLGTDAERVDEHEARTLGRLGDFVEQRLAGGVHAVGPAALAGPRFEHALARAGHDDVVGREEALLLVGELLVEGAPRDAREAITWATVVAW